MSVERIAKLIDDQIVNLAAQRSTNWDTEDLREVRDLVDRAVRFALELHEAPEAPDLQAQAERLEAAADLAYNLLGALIEKVSSDTAFEIEQVMLAIDMALRRERRSAALSPP